MRLRLGGREGSAMVTSMIIVLVVCAAGAGVIGLASQEAFMVNRIRDQIKADCIAEAGANEAYSILKTDFSKKTDASCFPEKEFDGGTYDADVYPYDDDDTRALIVCNSTYGSASATVKCDVKDFAVGSSTGGSAPEEDDPDSPWGHTFYVNGEAIVNSSGEFTGSIYSTGLCKMNGEFDWGTAADTSNVYSHDEVEVNGKINIKGTVQAPTIKKDSQCNIDATDKSDPGLVGPPDMTDLFNKYYQIASDNGQVKNGDKQYSGNLGTFPGGVRWVKGEVKLEGNVTFTGCIIAQKKVIMNGTINHTQYEDYPCAMSRDDEVEINATHDTHGLIYSAGKMKFNGYGSHEGAVICAGSELVINGEYDWVKYSYSKPSDPDDPTGGSSTDGQLVGITCWHR